MLKKAIPALLLALLFLLPACGQQAAKNVPADARVIFSDAAYTPVQNWIYSYADGLAADGLRMSVEEMIKQTADADTIPAPLSIDKGSARGEGTYSVYDLDGNEIYYRNGAFTLPEEPGEYLCVAELTFGTAENYSGYQLFFRFSVSRT